MSPADSSLPPLRDEPGSWPVRSSEVLHGGDWVLTLRADRISRPGDEADGGDGGDGATFRRYVVDLPGAVMILAVDAEERAVVLWQYRHPVAARMVELPAGLLDVPGEDPVAAAQRELREEAGLEADHWRHLVTVTPSPGISTETHAIYLATGLHERDRGGFAPEHEEADMTVGRVPVDDLLAAVLAGEVRDAPLVTALLAYEVHRRRGSLGE